MAKIVKLNVYEKTVYAVQVEDNLYIDEIGVKHLSPSPENCKNTRNVPPALRIAFEHLAKNHAARKKVEDKRAKFLKEIKQQLNELEKDECTIMKELRDAKGVISKDEFIDAFYEDTNATSFNRTFKKINGMTPAMYKKLATKEK